MKKEKRIYKFAIKWLNKFKNCDVNKKTLADECKKLGFKKDLESFFKLFYGESFYEYKKIDKAIEEIDDIYKLGSAIYSKEFSCKSADILKIENRQWFIKAFSRLVELSSKYLFVFKGKLKEISIVSTPCDFFSNDEIKKEKQLVYINSKGEVKIINYLREDSSYKKKKSKKLKIKKELAENILEKVATYFRKPFEYTLVFDAGEWDIKMTNSKGEKFKFSGPLYSDLEVSGVKLSNLIRESLDINELYIFDGVFKPDKIEKIVLDYKRVIKFMPKWIVENKKEYSIWEYSEKLIVDRKSQSIEHIQNISEDSYISYVYKIEGAMDLFLDEISEKCLFEYIEGVPEDTAKTSKETKEYVMTIDYRKKAQRVIRGEFYKNGLPYDFEEFAKSLTKFMNFYKNGEILEPTIYSMKKELVKTYIYCSVVFKNEEKSYYYIADSDEFKIDDYVLVPIGKNATPVAVRIVNIEYFTASEAPIPPYKTKHILGKY